MAHVVFLHLRQTEHSASAASYIDGRPHEHITVEQSGAPPQVELQTIRAIHAEAAQEHAATVERLKIDPATLSRAALEQLALDSVLRAERVEQELAELLDEDGDPDEPEPRSGPVMPSTRTRSSRKK